MKKFFTLFASVAMTIAAFAQTTLLSENFGTTTSLPTGWTSSSTSAGWNATTSSASSGYAGASGSINVVFNGTGSNGVTHTLTYANNFSTVGYNTISIIWAGRGTSTFNKDIVFEWSTDGTTWNGATYTYSKNSGSWALVNGGTAIQLPVGAENANNLSLRWSSVTSNNGNYRIDDVKIVGTANGSLATNEVKGNKNVFVKNTLVDSEINFGANGDVKIYNVNGQVVKEAKVSADKALNVQELNKGTYIVTGTVNGNKVSEKIIKK